MNRFRRVVVAVGMCVMPWVCLCAQDSPEPLDPSSLASGLLGQPLPEGTRGFTVAARPNTVSINIRFELNSATLKPEAAPQLESLWQALTLAQIRGKQVEISGHTDSSGSDQYNLRLSAQRAGAVRDFLLSKGGLDPERVTAVGRGEEQPVDKAKPEDPINRRVEVRLVPRVSE
jgi:outer membrane protein OmpA-like peptidoglycan-associated protein